MSAGIGKSIRVKGEIVAREPFLIAFTTAKHDWIVAALGQLGLVSQRPRRLYDDDPSLHSSHQLAS